MKKSRKENNVNILQYFVWQMISNLFLAILKQFSEAFFKSLLLHNAWEISPFFSQNSNSLVWIINYKKSLPTITIPFFSNSEPQLGEIFSNGEFPFLYITVQLVSTFWPFWIPLWNRPAGQVAGMYSTNRDVLLTEMCYYSQLLKYVYTLIKIFWTIPTI